MRLNRYLALAGWGARRKCDELIASGRVSVNGQRVTEPGVRVDAQRDRVTVDGETTRLPKLAAILVHKPPGVLVTRSDPGGRLTVLDIVKGAGSGLFPVGRLDRDSEGLLLLTNDGDLAFHLTHPRFGVERKYVANVRGDVAPEKLRRLARGVMLEDGPTAPAKVRVVRRTREGAAIELVLREGRNREVRRMCAAVGLLVTRLTRVAYGPLRLEGLRPGAWRRLRPEELAALQEFAAQATAPRPRRAASSVRNPAERRASKPGARSHTAAHSHRRRSR
jgi:pseudouridine synthase